LEQKSRNSAKSNRHGDEEVESTCSQKEKCHNASSKSHDKELTK